MGGFFSYHGQLNRGQFVLRVLIWILITYLLGMVLPMLVPVEVITYQDVPLYMMPTTLLGVMVYTLAYIFLLYVLVCLSARRARDMGQSGWLGLIVLLPLIGFICLIVFMFIPSKQTMKVG